MIRMLLFKTYTTHNRGFMKVSTNRVFYSDRLMLTRLFSSSEEISNKFKLPKRFQNYPESIWVLIRYLINNYNPLNFGVGFPGYPPPKYLTEALVTATTSSNFMLNQYTRDFGHPRLVNIISKVYSPLIRNEIDPINEIIISIGAYGALYCAINGLVDVGDEVIIMEPYFECYHPMVECVGGVAKLIPLLSKNTEGTSISSSDWVLDYNQLESLFNEKTKLIIINTPHNPIGKIFDREELGKIADLCKKWNVLCVSDEVYEWIVYEQNEHVRMCTLPGMWERTITIGSAGKTFSMTGWKIGWAYGPSNLIKNLQLVHQNCIYTCATPIQEAIAISFEVELKRFNQPDCYFKTLPKELLPKRDKMAEILINAGMKPTIPQGGYFMVADWTNLESKCDLSKETDKWKDYRFTKWMTKNIGVLGIPPSAFYSDQDKHLGENFIRYCFFKKDENIEKLGEILNNWK